MFNSYLSLPEGMGLGASLTKSKGIVKVYWVDLGEFGFGFWYNEET